MLRDAVADVLTRIGAHTPRRVVRGADTALNYLEVGRWLRSRGHHVPSRVGTRHMVFDIIASEICDLRVLYLEFGVYEGVSMRHWSSLLRNPESELHGFDKFIGLPEMWQGELGAYSARGLLPTFKDPRVHLHLGWFSETLPDYMLPDHERLVINIDADLYSSTKFVLEHLARAISVGTYVYFDEFQFREHEMKAFEEHLRSTGYVYRLLACSKALRGVAFQRVD